MFAVTVTFQIVPEKMQAFMTALNYNATLSLAREHGCRQFDVCTDPESLTEVFLYELYSDRVAFDAHLATAHFKAFDTEVADMIASKTVRTYAEVRQ